MVHPAGRPPAGKGGMLSSAKAGAGAGEAAGVGMDVGTDGAAATDP